MDWPCGCTIFPVYSRGRLWVYWIVSKQPTHLLSRPCYRCGDCSDVFSVLGCFYSFPGGARRGVSVLERKQHLALGNLGQKREKREAALRGHCAETPQKPARDGPGSVPGHSTERPKALGVLLSFNGWRYTLYSRSMAGSCIRGPEESRPCGDCDRGGYCVFGTGRKR